MCGISGVVDKRDLPIEPRVIERLTSLVTHRGPDGHGYYHGHNFALGHRRLSILDLSEHGLQPMPYRDRYWLTYNGEIYNYLELRSELQAKGHEFHSNTDSEVILAAYAEWGTACCARFNGMWAFVIYDKSNRTLFISRDRFGVKPLYYSDTPEQFVFGSEIRQPLSMLPSVRANRKILIESLLTSIEGHTRETFFEGVRSFPQSHFGVYDLQSHQLEIERYYELAIDSDLQRLSLRDAVDEFGRLFEDSVRIRLRSDVLVGTCLSGGLDSSATSAVGSRLYHQAAHETFIGVHARSMDPERDESRFAGIAAESSGIELHTVRPDTNDFLDNIDELIDTQEEPFGSPSMFMGWHVFQRAKSLGCKVMLNGQGGDEVLLGYERYFAAFLRSVSFVRFAREAIAQARHSRLSLRDVLLYNVYFTSPALRINRLKKRSFLRPAIKDAFDFDTIRRSTQSFRNLSDLQLFEISSVQLPHLLRYEDRNSMRHSIETRLPFLDYRLVELSISLPVQYKIHDGWTKYVLRRAMDGTLPESIAWRRDKMGFEAPERTWIGSATAYMKREIAGSRLLDEITDKPRLLDQFDSLPLRRKWAYFMTAAWERRQKVVA
jgi:asparagine synthase (glutamine-hydrolysing)